MRAEGVEFLRSFPWSGAELAYVDPPYLHSTRTGRMVYGQYELSDSQHEDLLSAILAIPAAVMISGYPSELYASRLAGWRSMEFMAMTRGGLRKEVLWMNFPEPSDLHDTRYLDLGGGFRGRQNLAKMKKRWIERLRRMNPGQRQALMDAIRGCLNWGRRIVPSLRRGRPCLD